jgi:hypothetical protein
MKLKKLAFLLSLAFAGVTQASNISVIDFSGTVSNIVTLENGTPMATGAGALRIGYFNTALQGPTWAADMKSNDVAKVNAAMAAFIPLGETGGPFGTGTGNTTSGPRFANRTVNGAAVTGRLAGQIASVTPTTGTANTANAAGVPSGTRIYLLVYSDGNFVLDGTEQFGVFSSATDWLMPTDAGLNLQLNATSITQATSATDIVRGSFGSLHLQSFIVPEPGTASMGLLAALGLLARRRR